MRTLLALMLCIFLSNSALAGDFFIKSSAFKDQARIPILYTCDGENISPPLSWGNAPANTQSFVLIFRGLHWINSDIYLWVLYNIPNDVKGLEEDVYELPKKAMVGTNFYDENKYRGPCPPDTREHEYSFTLYALDAMLYPIDDEIDPDVLMKIIQSHVIKETTLTGSYKH